MNTAPTAPRNRLEIEAAIQTMYDWHGGQSSAFYSFASTRIIHSEDHRQRCLAELKVCRGECKDVMDLADLASVESLIHHAIVGQLV